MKALGLLFFITLGASTSMAANNCAEQAEAYLTNAGYTSPAVLTSQTPEGNLVYLVRTTQNGGDAAYEVSTTSECGLVSIKNLWSE